MRRSSMLCLAALIALLASPIAGFTFPSVNSTRTLTNLESARIFGGGTVTNRCCELKYQCFYDHNSVFCPNVFACSGGSLGEVEISTAQNLTCTKVSTGDACENGTSTVVCKEFRECARDFMTGACFTTLFVVLTTQNQNICEDSCP